MASKILLDLKGVISPLALLKCKSCLQSMEKGSVVEVTLLDQDVTRDLCMIVQRSRDEIIYRHNSENHIRIGIRKG